MKTSILGTDVGINGETRAGLATIDPYLLYVNPYFVVRHMSNWADASKHYFMGSQRIASEVFGYPHSLDTTLQEAPSGPEKMSSGPHYPVSGVLGSHSAWANLDTLIQRFGFESNANFWDGLANGLLDYQEFWDETIYNNLADSACAAEDSLGPSYNECLCANSPFYAWQIHEKECEDYRILYWYHPDYLGHNEYITDMSGLAFQYFHFSAFGETLVQDAANYGKFDAPYRFNAKELDQEPSEASSRTPLKNKTKREQTGNYYYGASSRRDFEHKPRRRSAMLARPSPAFQREYYNPTWSVWLSVDPLSNHPNQVDKSPYAFSWNNPAKLVDPDGRCPECDEQYDSPEIGLIHVSSGGQVDQYLETRDENGNATGAEWTGLGGRLNEVQITGEALPASTKSQNTEDSPQNSNGTPSFAGGYGEISVFGLFTIGADEGTILPVNGVESFEYFTDHRGIKTDLYSFGGGGGLFFYSGDKSEITQDSYLGEAYNVEVSFSYGLLDYGIVLTGANVNVDGIGKRTMTSVGLQVSYGFSNPVASGGVTNTETVLKNQ